MGQRDGFSNNDVLKLNRMYKCTNTATGSGYKLDGNKNWPFFNNIVDTIFPANDKEDQEELI